MPGSVHHNVHARDEEEPIYGKHYLPRKFKIAVALPPNNDVDVYANDLSFIAIANGNGLEGFNVAVGGGMGMTHGQEETGSRPAAGLPPRHAGAAS
mgnify:CR=1 FL=1